MKRLAVFLALVLASCAHFPSPQPVLSCLATLLPAAIQDAVTRIYAIIDRGESLGQSEAAILAALKDEALSFGPDVWRCAMLFVASPDNPPDNLKDIGPNVTSRETAATIANDYLEQNP